MRQFPHTERLQSQPVLLFIYSLIRRRVRVLETVSAPRGRHWLYARNDVRPSERRIKERQGEKDADCGPASPLSIYDFTLRLFPHSPRRTPHSLGRDPILRQGWRTICGGGLINDFFSKRPRVVVLTYASHATLPISLHRGFSFPTMPTHIDAGEKETFCSFIQHVSHMLR